MEYSWIKAFSSALGATECLYRHSRPLYRPLLVRSMSCRLDIGQVALTARGRENPAPLRVCGAVASLWVFAFPSVAQGRAFKWAGVVGVTLLQRFTAETESSCKSPVYSDRPGSPPTAHTFSMYSRKPHHTSRLCLFIAPPTSLVLPHLCDSINMFWHLL